MSGDIQRELDRIVGGSSVRASEIESAEKGEPRIKLETANATYNLPRNRLADFLTEQPDGAGVNALRQALERRFPSASEP